MKAIDLPEHEMKLFRSCVLTVVFLFMAVACNRTPDCTDLYQQAEDRLEDGRFNEIRVLADSIRKMCPDSGSLIVSSDSLLQIAERIKLDFSLTEEDAERQLRNRTGGFTTAERDLWGKMNWLEYRYIEGEKRYFRRAPSNLILLRNFFQNRELNDSLDLTDPDLIFRRKHTQSVIQASELRPEPVQPAKMIVNYTLTVPPGAVPPGKTIRCWLPWPKENHARQTNVTFISASHEDYIISPDSMSHRTIYMETAAAEKEPAVFKISFGYQSAGQYFDPDKLSIKPYDKNSEIYRKHTSEKLPHICFTENVKKLTDSITGSDPDPFGILRKLYYWIDDNIPWAGALEYSTVPNIPEYVIRNRRGDCGMKTFLLMSMLRYKGIPVRWQSGWMMPPGGKNLHDWCEVYFEGPGWIPVDMSFGLQLSDDKKIRDFYISGIDAYRLIVNEEVAAPLWPGKKFLRSEPYDFQRGEVEWEGGNLYFDKWDYDMQIEYVDDKSLRSLRPEYQMTVQD